jgi:hypothetical protein
MAHYKFKAKITDDIEDARNIIQMVGKAVKEGKTDRESVLDNLSIALKKLDSARYYIDRE